MNRGSRDPLMKPSGIQPPACSRPLIGTWSFGRKTTRNLYWSLCSDITGSPSIWLRRCGRSSHAAEDLERGLFEPFVSRDVLRKAGSEKGSFREFRVVFLLSRRTSYSRKTLTVSANFLGD